jgi:hypothetical protein
MIADEGLTDFGVFCELYDIPVFDRAMVFEHWSVGRSRFEREYESWRRAEASGFRRRGVSRKNQF